MQLDPYTTDMNADANAKADVWELIQALVMGRLPADRILELFYWGQQAGVLETVRAILDLSPEERGAMTAFFSTAESKSISVHLDGSGRLILSSPTITSDEMIVKADEFVSADAQNHTIKERNIRSA